MNLIQIDFSHKDHRVHKEAPRAWHTDDTDYTDKNGSTWIPTEINKIVSPVISWPGSILNRVHVLSC